MNPLRSVGGRLSIALLLVVAGALGIAYLIVVPRLENRLIDAKKSQLETDGTIVTQSAASAISSWYQHTGPAPDWSQLARNTGTALNARVVLYRVVQGRPPRVLPLGDSGLTSSDIVEDPVAIKSALSGSEAKGVVRRRGIRYAEVAVPPVNNRAYGLPLSPRVLVSAPLTDTFQTVSLVKRRLAYAGLIALAVALVAGFAAARMFARRIRRLERAADRIAAGHFDEPVVDTGKDELGELAIAFDRMRQRLAHLEHARREFIANASHELRTPLFALAGLLELLDDEDLDEATRNEFLSTAREQSDRLTRLATDLLDLNRLDAGRLHVERETVELDELADTLADEFRAVAKAKEHRLEVLRARAAAVADEQRVLQIGRALVENALLHTPAGTTVRLRTRTNEDGRALLVVEDDGPGGIPGEHTDHVFERFYRVNGTVTSGSGLGLAIARELAELMGGQISVDSRPGLTAFTLSLPPARVPAAASVA
jgi:signal transduction histidine kinase